MRRPSTNVTTFCGWDTTQPFLQCQIFQGWSAENMLTQSLVLNSNWTGSPIGTACFPGNATQFNFRVRLVHCTELLRLLAIPTLLIQGRRSRGKKKERLGASSKTNLRANANANAKRPMHVDASTLSLVRYSLLHHT